MELLCRYSVFAEGARGHLGCQLIERFKLAEGKDPQSFALGLQPARSTNSPRSCALVTVARASAFRLRS